MSTNDYMYAIDRSDEYLAHYGIKGMKWGVRKAKESGNSKALARQYKKASRKLAKLEARAANGKKYRRRAALAGAGAAAAGGLAIAGTQGVAQGISGLKTAGKNVGKALGDLSTNLAIANAKRPNPSKRLAGLSATAANAARGITEASGRLGDASTAVNEWGKKSGNLTNAAKKFAGELNNASINVRGAIDGGNLGTYERALNRAEKISKWNNDTIARAGAAGVAAGLTGVAGYNAYRAATTKRAAKKANEFRSEMNKAFQGTEYANKNRKRKKR